MQPRLLRGVAVFCLLAGSSILAALGATAPAPAKTDASGLPPRLTILPPPEGGTTAPTAAEAEDEKETATTAENLRRWTTITQAEAEAADPAFRYWVELIRSGRADSRIMRLYSFYRSRLDPFDRKVPEGWRAKAWAALRGPAPDAVPASAVPGVGQATGSGDGGDPAGSANDATSSVPGISAAGVWVPVGPWTIPGRTTGLSSHPNEPDTLYAAVADGGAWRSVDHGATWEPLTDFEQTQSGGAILVDPSNPNTIYFGTGEGNGAIDNYGGIGVLKSTDSGKTWTASNAFSSAVRGLAINPSQPWRVYAAGDSGCYVSNDSGATFALMGGGLPQNAGASAVVVRPDDPSRVYCAIWGGANGGIYRSTDGGSTWSIMSSGLPAMGAAGRIALAISPSNPDILLAGMDFTSGTMFKTTNAGDTWNLIGGGSRGYCGSQCWYDNAVGFDAGNPNIMYAGGVSSWRTTDGGVSWTTTGCCSHVDFHAIHSPRAGEVILSSDGGVFRSLDNGSSLSNIGIGMDTTQYYGICRHPSDVEWAAGGTQDNGTHRRRLSDEPDWTSILGGDGGMCMTGPPSGSVMLGEYQNQNMQRSIDGGATFADANNGIGSQDPRAWVGIMTADPSDRNKMYTGTYKVYRSLNAKATNWIAISSVLYFQFGVTALEPSPASSATLYAGFDAGGLWVSTNATSTPNTSVTWSDIRKSYLPQRAVRRLRGHPANADTVYAVFSGFGAGKIWKTTDRGATWVDRTGDLPDVPVNDLTIDADSPSTIVAATDLGVFRTDNDGAHWYGWSPGLPTVASIELTYDPAAKKLRVGTHGRSMWQWQAASANPTTVPEGSPFAQGTAMTVERIGASQMRVRWDVRSCTAQTYNLFYGNLSQVASYTYTGANCSLGTAGVATVALPSTPSGSAFFLIASEDATGREGPHGFTSAGAVRPATGVGLCGVTAHVAATTCP